MPHRLWWAARYAPSSPEYQTQRSLTGRTPSIIQRAAKLVTPSDAAIRCATTRIGHAQIEFADDPGAAWGEAVSAADRLCIARILRIVGFSGREEPVDCIISGLPLRDDSRVAQYRKITQYPAPNR